MAQLQLLVTSIYGLLYWLLLATGSGLRRGLHFFLSRRFTVPDPIYLLLADIFFSKKTYFSHGRIFARVVVAERIGLE